MAMNGLSVSRGTRGLFALLMLLVPAAGHAAADQAQLTVGGSVSAKCRFVEVPASTDLGNLRTAGATNLGILSFYCNVPSGTPGVSISSQNGGFLRNGGTERIGYAWSWSLAGASGLTAVAASTDLISATLSAGPAHQVRGGTFTVRPASISTTTSVAGEYSDVITITVTP